MSAFWGLLRGAFTGLWGYAAAAAGAVLALLVVLSRAKKAGKDEVVVETQKKELEDVKKAGKVEREVAAAGPAARRERLSKRWTRDQ